jgi:phage terminase Nu1 subunit (DNA packaging protein)
LKGCPYTRTKTGGYQFDLKAVQRWRKDSMPSRSALPAGVASYSHARARKENALAFLRELQLRQRQGELIEVSAVKRATFAVSRMVRDNLENIPARISGPCVGKDQHEIFVLMSAEIRQCLEGLTHEDDAKEDDHTYVPSTPR